MKVDPNNLQSIANAQSNAVQNAKTSRPDSSKTEGLATDASGGSDTVQVSSKFAEAQQLTAKLQQVPDVRADRVSALKAKIQQGTYKPDPADVADAILRDPLNQSGKS
jgi:negative regulator of flagellin synthesis FlgM